MPMQTFSFKKQLVSLFTLYYGTKKIIDNAQPPPPQGICMTFKNECCFSDVLESPNALTLN